MGRVRRDEEEEDKGERSREWAEMGAGKRQGKAEDTRKGRKGEEGQSASGALPKALRPVLLVWSWGRYLGPRLAQGSS